MSTVTVPDEWPIVPVIAINRYPLFPGFIKRIIVSFLFFKNFGAFFFPYYGIGSISVVLHKLQ